MAGSLRTFLYTTDSGDTFLYTADESNTESIHATVPEPPTTPLASRFGLPRNLKPRSAYYASQTTTRGLRIIVANLATFNALPNSITDPIAGTGTLVLSGVTAEKLRLLKVGIDTGLTDGDSP